MASVYGRVAKISNAVGRSDYITDEKRLFGMNLRRTGLINGLTLLL